MSEKLTRDEVILAIYDAALKEAGWDAASQAILSRTDANIFGVQGIDFVEMRSDLWGSAGLNMGAYANLPSDWVQYDPFVPLLPAIESAGSISIASREMPVEEFEDSILLREIFGALHHEINDVICTGVVDGSHVLGGAMLYTERVGEYHTDHDIAEMRAFAPHIRKSIMLRQRYGKLRSALSVQGQLLDGLTYGVIILDHEQKIVEMNQQAENLLLSKSLIRQPGGGISAFWPKDDEKLQLAINKVCRPGDERKGHALEASHLKLKSQNLLREISAIVSPMCGKDIGIQKITGSPKRIYAIVSFSDREPIVDARVRTFAKACQLTAKEREILSLLVNGQTGRQISDVSGRSIETIRSQIKTILQKAEVNSQVELMRQVMSSPIVG